MQQNTKNEFIEKKMSKKEQDLKIVLSENEEIKQDINWKIIIYENLKKE